jgi:DNA-binding MarR family transcriptional regulator
MAQLERAPRGLKMSELSQRMMVTGGNVTGITDGLEKEGLVLREVDTTDRRVFHVKLSAEGQRQFRRMAAEHEQWVIGLFEGLSMKHKNQLVELLGELKRHIPT